MGDAVKQLYSFWSFYTFWISDLVRLYAWITLLADHGIINNFLMTLGVLPHPLPLCCTTKARYCLASYTPICPLWCCRCMPPSNAWIAPVLEAAADLGATPAECFSKVTLPLRKAVC